MKKSIRKVLILVSGFCMILTEAVNAAEVSYISNIIYGREDGMTLTYDVLKPENANGAAPTRRLH